MNYQNILTATRTDQSEVMDWILIPPRCNGEPHKSRSLWLRTSRARERLRPVGLQDAPSPDRAAQEHSGHSKSLQLRRQIPEARCQPSLRSNGDLRSSGCNTVSNFSCRRACRSGSTGQIRRQAEPPVLTLSIARKDRIAMRPGAHQPRTNCRHANPLGPHLHPQSFRKSDHRKLARRVRQEVRHRNPPPIDATLAIDPCRRRSICGNTAIVQCSPV